MNILDIFYNSFIKEASLGTIEAFFMYNIIFTTRVDGKQVTTSAPKEGILIPNLNIKEKTKFDSFLLSYVESALNFYDLSAFEGTSLDKIKSLLAYLFANATTDDFDDPISFLERRIKFLNSDLSKNKINAFIPIFNSYLKVGIVKDKEYNETPYKLVSSLNSDEGIYYFPEIKFGIADNTLYIYAIQNREQEKTPYTKKINRLLYKVNSGFKDESEAHLEDTTASFTVAASIILAFINTLGITKIKISSILIERWNAKKIAIDKKVKYKNLNAEAEETLNNEQEKIQTNLTEKFLRTFLRLTSECEGLTISSYPYDIDPYLNLKITGPLTSKNELLNDTITSITAAKSKENSLKTL